MAIIPETNNKVEKIQIVFFGSGPVAAQSLKQLEKSFEIEAIITKPTTMREMDVLRSKKPIFSVTSKLDLDSFLSKNKFESKIAILIDFGIIVSQKAIECFEFGIVNSHFSLLPQLRGADPISFSILTGQEKTGVSLMLIDSGMDTGKLIAQKSITISQDADSISLTRDLINLSAQMLSLNLPKYQIGEIKPRSQPHPDRATYSRKLTKDDGILDFNKSAKILEREIRAFTVWPKSRTTIFDKDVIVLGASVDQKSKGKIGTVFKTEDKKIAIQTSEGALIIDTLKPAGKNVMTSEAFLAGYGSKL